MNRLTHAYQPALRFGEDKRGELQPHFLPHSDLPLSITAQREKDIFEQLEKGLDRKALLRQYAGLSSQTIDRAIKHLKQVGLLDQKKPLYYGVDFNPQLANQLKQLGFEIRQISQMVRQHAVLRLQSQHPDWSLVDIAEKLKTSLHTIKRDSRAINQKSLQNPKTKKPDHSRVLYPATMAFLDLKFSETDALKQQIAQLRRQNKTLPEIAADLKNAIASGNLPQSATDSPAIARTLRQLRDAGEQVPDKLTVFVNRRRAKDKLSGKVMTRRKPAQSALGVGPVTKQNSPALPSFMQITPQDIKALTPIRYFATCQQKPAQIAEARPVRQLAPQITPQKVKQLLLLDDAVKTFSQQQLTSVDIASRLSVPVEVVKQLLN